MEAFYMKDYYKILRIKPNANSDEINKAYNILFEQYNPSLYPLEEREILEEKRKNLTEAYNILSDDFLRKDYDSKLFQNSSKTLKNRKVYRKEKKSSPKKLNTLNQKYFKGNYYQKFKKFFLEFNTNSPQERSHNLIAVILTIIIVVLISFICFKIPLIKNFLFP